MSEENKIVDLAARLVARGDHERADLIKEIARRQEAGEDAATEEGGGFNWRLFAIHFANEYPFAFAFAPISVLLYLYMFYLLLHRLIFGS